MKTPQIAATILALGFTSCSLEKVTTSAPPTGFITSTGVDTSSKIKRVPFDHCWRSPEVDVSVYKNIVIRPVTTSYLRKEEWANSTSAYIPNQESYVKRCNELAAHFGKSLREAFSQSVSPFYLTDSTAKPGTLILEVALTEVTFGRPSGYVGAMAVPGGGLVNSAAASPVCAFEARLRDAGSNKVIATAADRRGTTLKLVDFNQLTYHKANQEICEQWAEQLMEATNKELFPKVKKTLFTPF